MRKSIKIPLYIFLTFVLIFLIAISVVPLIFDPNDYKVEITEAVRKHTGRNLDIEGELNLQLLPKLAVTTGKIRMYNPEGFPRKTFAEIDSGFFRIRLVPLFSKRIDIKKIVLNGLKMHLLRTEDKRANWKKFRGTSESSKRRRIPIRYENTQPGANVTVDSPLKLLLATKIDIFGAEVDYEDQISGIKVEVKNLDFILDRFVFDRGINFQVRGNLSNSEPVFHETAAISGRISVNETMDRFKIEEFRWHSEIDGDFFPEKFRKTDLTAIAAIDLAEHTVSITDMRLVAGKSSITANLSATRIFAKPSLDGQFSVKGFIPSDLIRLAKLEYTPKGPDALKSLDGEFGISLSESKLVIKDIKLVLDDEPIRGIMTIKGFTNPKIKFNFSADRLDADRYLPESGSPGFPASPEPPPGVSIVGSDQAIHANNSKRSRDPESGTVQGILNLRALHYRGMLAENVQMAFNMSNGVIRSNQRFKKFYGGHLKGSVEFNNRRRKPVISLNQTLSDVQIGDLLQDLQGKKPIEGTLQSTIRLVGHGSKVQSFKSTLNGDISATFTDGQINGLNLDKAVQEAKKLIADGATQAAPTPDITRFSRLTYQATVDDGVLHGALLEATTTNFDLNGDGTIDLNTDALDYQINAVVNDNPEGIAGIKVKELKGARIPLHIGGTLSDPTFRPNVEGALQDPKIKAAAEKLKRKIDKKLGSGTTRRLLDNLF